ncbi:hypothetical protein [Amycolatopsis taiwanensis]|uniref:hypothetical protein n=1 Tax=Amycolatopsis taiwanensis TaxID=342230 RepID=UPI00316AE894
MAGSGQPGIWPPLTAYDHPEHEDAMTTDPDGTEMSVLMVEYDEDLRTALCAELGAADIAVTAASARAEFSYLVVDRMLSDDHAITFVQKRRIAGYGVPVLVLTARDTVAARVTGFAHRGDDYLVKSFAMAVPGPGKGIVPAGDAPPVAPAVRGHGAGLRA